MYKGKGWEILVPKRCQGFYSRDAFRLERAGDQIYSEEDSRRLEEARQDAVRKAKETRQDLRPNKLMGFAYAKEADSGAVVGLRQLDYITLGASVFMADAGDKEAGMKYASNLGVMGTVRTIDSKTIHSKRRSNLASWGGYDSVFGCGLTGDENGDPDKLIALGAGRLFDLMAQRVVVELGINEDDVEEINLEGIVEAHPYGDHIIAFDVKVGVESGKILDRKEKLLKGPAGKKYEDIFCVDLRGEDVGNYLKSQKILTVAFGNLVLTGVNLFGQEWIDGLRRDGVLE